MIPGGPLTGPPGGRPGVASDVLREQVEALRRQVEELARLVPAEDAASLVHPSRLELFHSYIGVFVVAFLVTLISTPIMRRLAVSHGIIDRPSVARKVHRIPVAYLGGVGVYLGLAAAVLFSYTAGMHGLLSFHPSKYGDVDPLSRGVPMSVLLGMTIVMLIGLWDDVVGIDPRAKIAGMLIAAAALAVDDVGVKVAAGVMMPAAKSLGIPLINLGAGETIGFAIHLGGVTIPVDLVYWVGTAVIAAFVLGACNAANLIDGLDGLLSGTTAIAAIGLLALAFTLALADDGPRDAARIALCLALLGACLGFLPHNFNPATIFLGDCGSLLLGFTTIVIVLSLGDTGKTHLVVAGLIVFAVPIIDTTLAIFRRKISGKKISDADDQHLHHMLKRALGVKGAVLVMYGIAAAFAVLGVSLSLGRVRVIYTLTLVLAAFIGVIALKAARREHIERQAADRLEREAAALRGAGGGAAAPAPAKKQSAV